MKATNLAGHAWEGGKQSEGGKTYWMYLDEKSRLYESTEVPAYRIRMDNATQQTIDGRRTIKPL